MNMKLQAEIDGEVHQIELNRKGGELTAVIDGRTVEADISEPEPGVYLFNMEGRVIEAFAGPSADGRTVVSVHGRELTVRVTDPKRLRGSADAADAAGGRAEIRTAMPGKVVRILVEKGAEVHKGEGLIVVEAMKMQNEMKSPKAGTVAEVRVAEGATVGAGDVLLVIE